MALPTPRRVELRELRALRQRAWALSRLLLATMTRSDGRALTDVDRLSEDLRRAVRAAVEAKSRPNPTKGGHR